MSSNTERVVGKLEELGGTLKDAAAVGIVRVEGAVQRLEGSATQLAGAVQATVGDILSKPKMKAAGDAAQRKGRKARVAASRSEG